MAGPGAILRELHRLKKHVKDLQSEIERGPRSIKAHEGKIAKQEEMLREAHDTLKRLKVATHEKEVTLKTKNQQIEKHEKQLNESTSKKEYDALKTEIVADKQASRRMEDDILDTMGAAEDQTARLPELEQAVQKAKQESQQVVEDVQSRRNTLTELLNTAHQQLREVEASLPEEVRALYERLAAARGEDALSTVEGRTCVACYTEITAQNYNELRQGMFVACKTCGRILYLAE